MILSAKETALEVQEVGIQLTYALSIIDIRQEFFEFSGVLRNALLDLIKMVEDNLGGYELKEVEPDLEGTKALSKVLSLLEVTFMTLAFLEKNKETAMSRPLLFNSFKQKIKMLLLDWEEVL